jgi:hypothetical protein
MTEAEFGDWRKHVVHVQRSVQREGVVLSSYLCGRTGESVMSLAKRVLYGVVVVAGLVVSACSGSTHTRVSTAVTHYFPGLPRGISVNHFPQRERKPWAVWAGRRSIYVMTWGSSSCPDLPTSVKATGPGRLVISSAGLYANHTVCTADLAVTTSVVRLPAALEHDRTLVVEMDGSSIRVAARARSCGAWSAADSVSARAIVRTRGRLGSCQLIGRTWIVTAVSASRPGEIGLLTCAAGDLACLDGNQPHDLTKFTWIAAPAQIGPGLKIYGGTGPDGPIFVYATRHHGQVKFDLRTRAFALCAHGICRW